MADQINARPVRLHVIHDLGGGSTKWLADFIGADESHRSLVLRSFSHGPDAGNGLTLHEGASSRDCLGLWAFSTPIPAVALSHPEYLAALHEIVRTQGVASIVVSSLIGHSLDALDTGLPTLVVNHDYFPYCAAINLFFDSPCERCDGEAVARCEADNPRFNPFVGYPVADRMRVRERYLELIRRPHVRMVAPSDSVRANLVMLDARFGEAAFAIIPHGYADPLAAPDYPPITPHERLRIVVLGQLSVAKGVEVLRGALQTLTRLADVYLLGCRELGEEFRFRPHVRVIERYEMADLPVHMRNIAPHLGLLLSIVPETFSYALSELMMLRVPPVATRLGSFAERIRDGENGFLFEPSAAALTALVGALDGDRDRIAAVRANLQGWSPRSAAAMVADYERALPPAAVAGPRLEERASGAAGGIVAQQAMRLSNLWKDVKTLSLQVSLLAGARERAETLWKERTTRIAAERQRLEQRLADSRRALAESDARLAARAAEVRQLSSQLDAANARVAEMLASTSWRISAPVRWAGNLRRRSRILGRSLRAAARDPRALGANARSVFAAWRSEGLLGLKLSLIALQSGARPQGAWEQYREAFAREVRPKIVERIGAMPRRPRVSVIVPTYETPAEMLRATLESVRRQLYPEWELCVVDDGSRAPHVRRILEEFARRDARIRIDVGGANAGVSHASNRALAMATGEFVALLDHDDLLEEQALFRLAEAIVEDDPDLLYSDEMRVNADGESVRDFTYRPAFSPEFLREHPYIVHLVAFRASLLREIGGFDERLRISQDYDLILRAAEKARRIVHVPEILYRWRIHGESAGHARMGEVMDVSAGILQRHLERLGEPGHVEKGIGFNLFEARYPLQAGLRVAIVIPTRNKVELLQQCIESIRATVKEVAYDIVVVDHDSDDPATLRYLARLADGATIVRHSGAFNFSEINNRAVAALGARHTHYLFCNNDIEAIREGWLERMLELGQRRHVGIVGARLLYGDRRTIQHAGVAVGVFRAAEHYGKFFVLPQDRVDPGYLCSLAVNREVSAVTAACMLVRRDAFEAVRGFDEAIMVGFGDVDLCLRVRDRGYRVMFCAHADLVHHESQTRGTTGIDDHPDDTAEFRGRWKGLLEVGDPYYNPGLSPTSTQWAVRQPMACALRLNRRVFEREAGRTWWS